MQFDLFGENFDWMELDDDPKNPIQEFSDEDYQGYRDTSENEVSVESPTVEVRDGYMKIFYLSTYGSAEVSAEFKFAELLGEVEVEF